MSSWSDFQTEVNAMESPIHTVRREYLKRWSDRKEVNIITYYSGWLQKPGVSGTEISDVDLAGFVKAMDGLHQNQIVYLVLHTPGGDVAAAASIINSLGQMTKDINVIVPELCLSAGTMIACSFNALFMSKQARLGPVDQEFSGISARSVVTEFRKAIQEVKKDPGSLPVWQTVIGKYHPAFIGQCESALSLAKEIVTKSFSTKVSGTVYLDRDHPRVDVLSALVDELTSAKNKACPGYVDCGACREFGLRVDDFDSFFNDQDHGELLTIHQAYRHTFANTPALKIIENQNGDGIVINSDQVPANQKKQSAGC